MCVYLEEHNTLFGNVRAAHLSELSFIDDLFQSRWLRKRHICVPNLTGRYDINSILMLPVKRASIFAYSDQVIAFLLVILCSGFHRLIKKKIKNSYIVSICFVVQRKFT
jgi:hypothetical protein